MNSENNDDDDAGFVKMAGAVDRLETWFLHFRVESMNKNYLSPKRFMIE